MTTEPQTSAAFQQERGVAWDIIEEALVDYDNWMLDDDYEAMPVLHRIMERMRERRALYHTPSG